MPVIGHGLFALATRDALGERLPLRPFTLPTLAVLAYLPDLAAQVGDLVNVDGARLWAHSLIVGAAMALPAAALAAPLLGARPRNAFLIALFSIWAHDGLDLLQSADRVPLWPLTTKTFSLPHPWIPTGLMAETALFGSLALGTWLWRRRTTPRGPRAAGGRLPLSHALGASLVVGMLVLAAWTSHLREVREADQEKALALIELDDAASAFAVLDRAERWPSPSKPGRIDYLRGAAYNALGDRAAAEHFYLLSLRKDPLRCWTVAGLAIFYAEDGGPVADRRRRAAPYMDQLRRSFAGERECRGVLERVERKLGAAAH